MMRWQVRILSVALGGLVLLTAPLCLAIVCGDGEPDAGEECDDGNLANGDGCSATCTIEAGFDCSDAIDGQADENLLLNGSFENGPTDWIEAGTPNTPIATPIVCNGCDLSYEQQAGGWFWSGGAQSASSTSATQALTIPVTATTLTFNVWEAFCVPDNGTGDFVGVTIDGTEVFNSGICSTEGAYAQAPVIDLGTAPGGPYNDGGIHTIAILGTMDFTPGDPNSGTILVDNLSVIAPLIPAVLPIPSACTAVVCGDGLFPQFSAAGTEQCDDGNTIKGDGCSRNCKIEQPDFVCEDPLPPSAAGEVVIDGGLESGRSGPAWTSTGTQSDPICSQVFCGTAQAADGAFFAWFGGSSMPNTQTLTQDVVIASTATHLTFDLLVGICDTANDALTVEIDGTEIYRYDCTVSTSEYLLQSVSLGSFADGGVHTVQFIGNTVATNAGNSNFFVDNISIKDNVAFAGLPGVCTALPAACNTPEQFEGGLPAGWTVINTGPNATDGWGVSNDGICGSQNWAGVNVTNGGGLAACADSDATGQIAIDGGGSAVEMDTYLCSPALDLSPVTDPVYTFLVNYQAADNTLNDNGTPGDTSDDFDDDFLDVLVGTSAPNSLTVPGYTLVESVFDHLDSTLDISKAVVVEASLHDQSAWSSAHVCFHYRGTFAWFAQIDNAALRGISCTDPDTDGDGIPNSADPDDDNDLLLDQDENTAGTNPLDPDSDDDGIGDLLDTQLLDPANTCTQVFPNIGIMAEVINTNRTCAARASIVVSTPTVVINPGQLTLIAPFVTFEPGFSVGKLIVISADPCPGCSP